MQKQGDKCSGDHPSYKQTWLAVEHRVRRITSMRHRYYIYEHTVQDPRTHASTSTSTTSTCKCAEARDESAAAARIGAWPERGCARSKWCGRPPMWKQSQSVRGT